MSYKYTVLQDKPTCFYLLDEVRSSDIGSYTSVMSQFATYQDLKDGLSSYSALSGLPVFDYSGNAFDGYAINSLNIELMPLISGGVRGTQVFNDTKIVYNPKGIASAMYADDAFSIEMWLKVTGISSDSICILGDPNNNIGFFYQNGNIDFRINDTKYVTSRLVLTEASHIVALFNKNSISLFINGNLVDSILLDNYMFLNETFSLQSGPSAIRFIIDSVGIYKFNLSLSQIRKHYFEGIKELKYSQIVNLDGGKLFSINSSKIRPVYSYSYPGVKKWEEVADANVSISPDSSYIYFEKTDTQESKYFSFTDTIFVPTYLDIISSQIYFEDMPGILVEISLDNQNWETCHNGMPLPYINKTDNQISDLIYLKVTMATSDASKYLPTLSGISLVFYSDKDFYGDNSGYKISSNYDYGLGDKNYRVISYNDINGIRMYNGGGFNIDMDIPTESIEFIFSPNGSSNTLLATDSAFYGWNSQGDILKSGISSIYVNNKDVTLKSNISDFFVNDLPHHVVITLSLASSSNIYFNQRVDGTSAGGSNLYSNIGIYPNALTSDQINNHYFMYTDKISVEISEQGIAINESSVGTNSTSYTLLSVEPQAVSI
jgi:hypothetical protein